MVDTCRAWLYGALILVAVSLFFAYDKGGMRRSTIWVAGGPRFSESVGSDTKTGMAYQAAVPGYRTNGLLLGIIPACAALVWFAAPTAPRRRQRWIAGITTFLLLSGIFLTKGEGYGGRGFYLGLVGLGCAVYAWKVARQHPEAERAPTAGAAE